MTKNKRLMSIALSIGELSYCKRANVGCLLVREGRIIASGYNGTLPGETHCDPLICNPETPCTKTVHAEQNLISFCAKYQIKTQGAILYTTLSPCKICAMLIIQAGISQVFYLDSYRDDSPISLLKSHNIRTHHLTL